MLFLSLAMLVFLVGPDLPTHLHNAWLFNGFMNEGGLHLYDPYTSGGNQFVYGYGLVSYVISGLLYNFVGFFAVDVAQMAFILIMAMISYYLVKDWRVRAVWFIIMAGIFISDTFPNFTSIFLFVMAVYLSTKGKERLFQIFLILASLNHPFVTPIILLMASKDKKVFSASLLVIFFLQLTVLRTGFYQTSGGGMLPVQIFISLWRSVVMLFPFLIIPMEPTKRFYDLIGIIHLKRERLTTLAKTVTYFSIFYFVFMIPSVMAFDGMRYFFMENRFEGIPQMDGIVRVVDDVHHDYMVHLPKEGIVMSNSQYFEGRDTIFSGDFCGYMKYLVENDISYVFIKENGLFSDDEKEFLIENFKPVFRMEGYVMFNVSLAGEMFSQEEICMSDYKLSSEYDDFINWGLMVLFYNVDEFSEKVDEMSEDFEEFSEELQNISQSFNDLF